MTPSSSQRLSAVSSQIAGGRPSECAPLAMRLAEEMASCWARGLQPSAEEFLNRSPELWDVPEVVLQLLYEEICLRQERGEQDAAQTVMARFPRWQRELQVLLDCQLLIDGPPREALTVGAVLGEFRLVAELGRGAVGGVWLAVQPGLADRPVVLKLTPRQGQEHLSLARLQHTHIVPLYTVCDDLTRNLRILCMPYFGGASLAQLLQQLADVPAAERTGRHLIDALDRLQACSPLPVPARGGSRERLQRADFVEVMCWIAACLADGLHYAHERGLLHLDLKPANVLLANDGTPMLLDFHLARGPLAAGDAPAEWLGGTPLYMAPEQAAALAALQRGEAIATAVDSRADIYALGLLLYEALGGPMPFGHDPARELRRRNPRVSVGLSDVIRRCLASDPRERYPSAAALGDDLRRHLGSLPLRGVANRSLMERWRKWRRRQPHALAVLGGMLAVAGVLALAGDHVRRVYASPRTALHEGLALKQSGDITRSAEVLKRGLDEALALPFTTLLRRDLEEALGDCERELTARRQAETAEGLHVLADRIRFASVLDPLPAQQVRDLADRCRVVWQTRDRLLEGSSEELRRDLLDVAVIGAGLSVKAAPADAKEEARRAAQSLLDEAERLCGASPLLDAERARHGAANRAGGERGGRPPRSAWEAGSLGRALLEAGKLTLASEHFAWAVEQSPGDFWAHFFHGVCAYRLGQHRLAAERFGVCVALNPRAAACYYNRGLARAALGETERALADHSRALTLDPYLAAAALQRGLLHAKRGERDQARRDLQYALAQGADAVMLREMLQRLEEP